MLSVVRAQPDDIRVIAELMEEVHRFYGGTEFEPINDRVQQINAMLFRKHPAAYVLIAKDGDRALGFAAYSFLWPAVGLTQSLYLKDFMCPKQTDAVALAGSSWTSSWRLRPRQAAVAWSGPRTKTTR